MEITFDPINFYDAFLTRWLGGLGSFKASESGSKNDKNYQKIQIFQPPPVLRLVELDKKTHQKNHKKSIFQISINFKASESRSKIENHKKSIFRISANFKVSESRSKNEKKTKKSNRPQVLRLVKVDQKFIEKTQIFRFFKSRQILRLVKLGQKY